MPFNINASFENTRTQAYFCSGWGAINVYIAGYEAGSVLYITIFLMGGGKNLY
jgi:hypothetical protein